RHTRFSRDWSSDVCSSDLALEQAITAYPNDLQISIAYAKALTAAGRFDQSLGVLNNVIRPDAPDWNALLVKGATLDQMGQNEERSEERRVGKECRTVWGWR